MARKKKKNREERADEFHSLHEEFKRQTKGKLSSINPKLKTLTIEYSIATAAGAHDPKRLKGNLSLSVQDAAYIKLPCPSRECLRGGFDITDSIRTVLTSDEKVLQGTSTCHGLKPKEGAGKQECGNEATYTLRAEFN